MKLIANPAQIKGIDDLYDLIELNKGNPTKYLFIRRDSALTLQNKMFRKAFYENSVMFDDMMIFAEIQNPRLAAKLGIDRADQIVCVQNSNEYASFKTQFKILNLELERAEPIDFLLDSTIQSMFGEYLKELTPQEQQKEFMFSENKDLNLYERLLSQLKLFITEDSIIYGQTKKGLKFLKSLMRDQMSDVLFVALKDTPIQIIPEMDGMTKFEVESMLQIKARERLMSQLHEIKQSHPDLKIIVTDVKEGPQALGLIAET